MPSAAACNAKAFVAAPGLYPMGLVVGVRYEDGDTGGAAYVFDVLVVFTVRPEKSREQRAGQPARQRRIARRPGKQPVLSTHRFGIAETNPCFQFGDKSRVIYLRRVALNDIVQNFLHRRLVGDEHQLHARPLTGEREQTQVFARYRLAVEGCTGALPLADGLEKGGLNGLRRLQIDPQHIGWYRFINGFAFQSVRQRGLHQILGSAAKRDIQVVIVRIDRRAPARQIRNNGNARCIDRKLPALGVVAGWRERCVANQLAPEEKAAGYILRRRAPYSSHRVFIVTAPAGCGTALQR